MATPLRAEINGDIAFETVIKLHKKNLNKTIQGQGLCLQYLIVHRERQKVIFIYFGARGERGGGPRKGERFDIYIYNTAVIG